MMIEEVITVRKLMRFKGETGLKQVGVIGPLIASVLREVPDKLFGEFEARSEVKVVEVHRVCQNNREERNEESGGYQEGEEAEEEQVGRGALWLCTDQQCFCFDEWPRDDEGDQGGEEPDVGVGPFEGGDSLRLDARKDRAR